LIYVIRAKLEEQAQVIEEIKKTNDDQDKIVAELKFDLYNTRYS
jgi:hypothetical protein